MAPVAEPLVTIPIVGTPHAHTGCYHVECPLSGGLVLWLFGGYPPPQSDRGRPLFRTGQVLGGYIRPTSTYSEEVQAALERSDTLNGLAIEWVEFPFPDMRRWFQFRVEPTMVSELVTRLRAFASRCQHQTAEPSAATG